MSALIQDTTLQFPTGRFQVLSSEEAGRCATFELIDEDHTLGNALRHMILKNPEVKFCGYALPHPNERKINFQIQVYKDCQSTALDILEKGFRDLIDLNSIVKAGILEAAQKFGHVDLELSEDEDDEKLKTLLDDSIKPQPTSDVDISEQE